MVKWQYVRTLEPDRARPIIDLRHQIIRM